MNPDYASFIETKVAPVSPAGFTADVDHGALFPFQRDAVTWALRQGRCALFEDTGLGKSIQQLVWADHVTRQARAEDLSPRVLILAPLAVTAQTQRESTKFGIPNVQVCQSQADVKDGITITNYDRLGKFDPAQFSGVVLDESSILKAFSGTTKKALVEAFSKTPYRLACTATPAPNDHLELGNHSEFLGVLSSHQMIARWFINDASEMGNYRLKGHAVEPFWDWVTSWARCIGKPSDVGPYSDAGYVLPDLKLDFHSVAVDLTDGRQDGQLFRQVEISATELHRERRRTAGARAAEVARIVAAESEEQWLLWCDTDYDADAVRAAVAGVTEVHGSHTPEKKSALLLDFADGKVRRLLTKPGLAGLGLNFQGCARIVFVGPSYSYEQFYQAIRRCWRFGQLREVVAHVILAQTDQSVKAILARKAEDHEAMKVAMFAASRRAMARSAQKAIYNPTVVAPLPAWLREAA